MPKSEDKKKGSVIVVSSDGEDNLEPITVADSDNTEVKTGKKRSNTDDTDAGSSKRHKGKEVAQPSFHPPRPQPRSKTNAKVSKYHPSCHSQAHANV